MRRRRGTGTIERKNGRYAARLPTTEREILGVCDTAEEAGRLLDGWLAERAEGSIVPLSGQTLREFGEAWLDRRELDGLRSVDTDRSRWANHVAKAPFAGWPMRSITRAAILDWVDGLKKKRVTPGKGQARPAKRRKLGRSTIQSTLNLVRCCLADALARHLVDENPADGVRLRMAATKTEEPWTYLTLDEQNAIATCEAIPAAERQIVRFAFGSGLRQGELWNLELRDLHVADDEPEPRVFVRFGSKGKPPKNGKTRTVPLFGVALDAARRWLELLPTYATKRDRRTKTRVPHNPEHLVFPTATGTRRQKSKPAGGQYIGDDGRVRYRFHDWMRAAAKREVRWHDLRHTCASALVSGMWGRRWSQEEVRDLLGHSSVKVTERYAHLAPSALTAAAAATGGGGGAVRHRYATRAPNPARQAVASAWNHSAPPAGIGPATFGLGNTRENEAGAGVTPQKWLDGGLQIAARLVAALDALGAGEPYALRRLIEASEEAAELLSAVTGLVVDEGAA